MSDSYAAVIFDMDGVVTDTASVHRRAWKQLFDEYLAAQAPEAAPFTDADYFTLIDGRVRIDGVGAFLASRDITLPLGRPSDAATGDTAWALANRKNELFLRTVHHNGVDAFESTLAFIRRLRDARVRTALVTASRNADLVLATVHATELFDVRVDGVVAEELGLAGKPDPATFVEAARRLGLSPGTCVVVEDARAGVEAGRAGRFGLVVGIARRGEPEVLRAAGADVVVADLEELPDDVVYRKDPWFLGFRGFDPAEEGRREALLTVGNGYVGTRGAMVHVSADTVHYPGTYVAGVYNRLVSHVDHHDREDESIVNLPNWIACTLRCDGGAWLAPSGWWLAGHQVALELRTAVLHREATLIDPDGRRTRLVERRFASMDDPHTVALQLRLTPENWSGRLELCSVVDGRVVNGNVAEYRLLAERHLTTVERRREGPAECLVAETSASHVRIAVATATRVERPEPVESGPAVSGPAVSGPVESGPAGVATRGIDRRSIDEADVVGHEIGLDVAEGEEIVVSKIIGIATSRDYAIADPATAAISAASSTSSFETLLDRHVAKWIDLWRRFHVELIDGSEQLLAIRVNLVHLLQSLSPHSADIDTGVPSRGLHGEGYRGHVFWDELFVFPLLDYRLPELTQSLLRYRWRRLPEARAQAAECGALGALFPWQSGSSGREETPRELFNPLSGRWMPDNSRRQYHVNLADRVQRVEALAGYRRSRVPRPARCRVARRDGAVLRRVRHVRRRRRPFRPARGDGPRRVP